MMHLLLDPLPETITADGKEYGIVTDFREWFRFAEMLTDKELTDDEKIECCGMWLDPEPAYVTPEMLDAIIAFYHAKALLPDRQQDEDEPPEDKLPRPPAFDWKIDARFLLGDFRRYYGIDLQTMDYLHWWEFQALFSALPDESLCSKRIEIRQTDLGEIKDKTRRNQIAKIQRQIALPFEYDDEMIGAMLWNM